jgi:hypothetical protein
LMTADASLTCWSNRGVRFTLQARCERLEAGTDGSKGENVSHH